jgi:polyisoprenoid-binding protein YceI
MRRQGSTRSARFLLGAAILCACKRTPPPPERTEPWPAPGVASAAGPSAAPNGRVYFRVERGEARFELPAKSGSPSGRFSPVEGSLDLDLSALDKSHAEFRVDLGSLELDAADAGPSDRRDEALNWMGLGQSVSAAQREHLARATFKLEHLEGDGGKRFSDLRRTRGEKAGERRVHVTARGQLALLGVRAPTNVSLEVEFEAADDDKSPPERLIVRTQKPITLPLSTFGIEPRDARGTLLARELTRLGSEVGKSARVTLELTLVQSDDHVGNFR